MMTPCHRVVIGAEVDRRGQSVGVGVGGGRRRSALVGPEIAWSIDGTSFDIVGIALAPNHSRTNLDQSIVRLKNAGVGRRGLLECGLVVCAEWG